MTSAGKRMSIRIDKNAFEQFLKEKAPGMKMAEIAVKIGVNNTSFSHAKGKGYFSLENLSRMSKFFGVNMWSLPFVNDEAYTISFKLTTNLDIYWRARMIYQIRGLLADGVPQDKVRDIVLSDILAGKYTRSIQSDSESKSIPMETPKATLTHSAVSEAFDEVANSEEKTLGNIISEHADKLVINTDAQIPTDPTDMYDSPFAKVVDETEACHTSVQDAEKRLRLRELLLNSDPQIKNQFIMNVGRISNMERYLRDREQTAAQTLAKSLITHIKQLSTLGYCDRDKAERYKRLEDSRHREIRMKKEFWIWKASQGICKDLRIRENGSLIKDRPWLEAIWFFFDSAMLNKDMWQEKGKLMIEQLKLENFSGRYSIEKGEEPEND